MFVLKSLRSRPIALLWGGQVLSSLGDEVYKVAVAWIAISFIGKNAGYLMSVECAAVLVCGLFGGIWADRWDHRRTMIGVDIVRGFGVLIIPIAASLGLMSVWVLLLTIVIVSSLSALFDPALQALLPEI